MGVHQALAFDAVEGIVPVVLSPFARTACPRMCRPFVRFEIGLGDIVGSPLVHHVTANTGPTCIGASQVRVKGLTIFCDREGLMIKR